MRVHRLLSALALLAAVMWLTGCAGPAGMTKSTPPAAASADEATVVFMRSTFVGSAISASVFDVSQPQTEFIGMVQNGTKLAYRVPPGDHVFMVVSEAADFMKATVLPGKTYYVLVTPRMGVWRARFSFRPLRQADLSGAEFASLDKDTVWVQTSAEAESWAARNAADIEAKRGQYWVQWTNKGVAERDAQTLFPGDGR